MKTKTFLLILLSFICVVTVTAQKSNKKTTISGSVVDANKNPIANAIIMVDGKNTSTMSDSKGMYTIKVKPTAVKIGAFTFGSGIKEEEIQGRTEIDFNFGVVSQQSVPVTAKEATPGDKGVDVGYGVIKDKYVSSQVDKIDGTNKKYASYRTIYEMIEREVPGVKVSGTEIVIQDAKNLWGPIPALIVVDGTYVTDISGIQPITVKSIEVLKGASASMYGSRGTGGVIVIKTKTQVE